jgi:hypothetical protein
VTIHLAKGAAKSHRLDEAAVRKRAATRGDRLVEVKAGDALTGIAVGWTVDRFIKIEKKEERLNPRAAAAKKTKAAAKAKRPAAKKSTGRKTAAKKTTRAKSRKSRKKSS